MSGVTTNTTEQLEPSDEKRLSFRDRMREKLQRFENWSHGYLEKKYESRRLKEDVDENPEIVFIQDSLAGLSFDQMTGAQRLRVSHFQENGIYSVENKVTLRAMTAGSVTGALVCGILGQSDALQRFETYSVGKSYGNARNAMRRKMDYAILMFIKNGIRGGVRLGAVIGLSMFTSLNVALYRHKYSSYYFPLTFGVFTALSMARGGTVGLAYGFPSGLLVGLSISAGVLGYSFYTHKSINEAYWDLRANLNEELRLEEIRREKVKRLMEKENIPFEFIANYRLKDVEAEEAKRIAENFREESPNDEKQIGG